MLQIDPMIFGVVVLALAIGAVLVPMLRERTSSDSETTAIEPPQLEPKRIVVRAESPGQSVPTAGAPRAAAPTRPVTASPSEASADGLAPLKLPVG